MPIGRKTIPPSPRLRGTGEKKRKKKASERFCITTKLEPAKLKQALIRRKAALRLTQSLDQSVPTSFQKISASNSPHPLVQILDAHTLSPFIIHLNDSLPSPHELLEMETCHPLAQLNFLAEPLTELPPVETISPEWNWQPAPASDLALSEADLTGQLEEASLFMRGWSRLSLPKFFFARKQKVEELVKETLTEKHRAIAGKVASVTPPKDIFAYFDLPDEEAVLEEEAELVDLNMLATTTQEQEKEKVLEEKTPFVWPKLSLPKISFPSFSIPFLTLPHGWQRAIGAFVLVSFAFVLPLHAMNVVQEIRQTQQQVTNLGAEGFSLFETGTQDVLQEQSADASQSFLRASAQFTSAKESISNLGTGTTMILSALPMTSAGYQTGQHLVQAGESLSFAGLRLSEGITAINNQLKPTTTSRLALFTHYVESALPHLKQALSELENIDSGLIPASQQATFQDLATRLPILYVSMEEFVEFSEMLSTILGADGTKRYLLIFQNNTELRPTGGFMGSFAEMKIHDGEIVEMNIPGGGTYDLQGSLQTSFISPEPLQLLSAKWEFQDANWFADFPTSSRTMISFYNDAGGPTVDGVIAVNATYISKLIGLLGPMEMESYDRTIDEENFLFEAQRIVEHEYDLEENKPKAFIGDLAEVLLERIMAGDAETFLSLLTYLNQGLVERDVQIYFTDDSLQKEILDLGWGGSLQQTSGDYLLIADTNLGGGKTDGVIAQKVDLSVNIDSDGVITNTLSITRTHYGIQGTIFTGVNNVDYMRVYVPKGSELLSASGFSIPDDALFDIPSAEWEIHDELYYLEDTYEKDYATGTDVYEESGKTVFGNWAQTNPGTSSTVQITYRLPFTLQEQLSTDLLAHLKQFIGIPQTAPYTLTLQKQSGVIDRVTTVYLQSPENATLLWSSHDLEQPSFTNQTDQFFSTLFELE